MKKTVIKIVAIVTAVAVLLATVCAVSLVLYSQKQNETILVSPYTVSHAEIPAAFDGKRIVHLSDLHNCDFGDQLAEKVKAQSPDIIVITGDWIGKNDTDIAVAKRHIKELVEIAPIYYVPGNHEAESAVWDEFYAFVLSVGVIVMENVAIDWTIGDERVQLVGVFDPEFSTHLRRDYAPLVREELYSIMLYHRPESFEETANYGADLLFCGHTHGGQIRLPFIGAIYAPSQYWFPTYDVGRFESGGSTMIISQGLGQSVYMRVLTPPEIVVVTLRSGAA
ncbi:MAG: metallophosphoesterase family protein [Clostridia bacterium]|nr:metallophosphoesterase family protein [Clostridia bacterium]